MVKEYYHMPHNILVTVMHKYNLNQTQLAKLLGVSRQSVSAWYCYTSEYTTNKKAWEKLHLLGDAMDESKFVKAAVKFICRWF